MKITKRGKIKIVLPIKPLSTNTLWTGRRFPTDEYKAYRKQLALFLATQKLDHVPGYILAHYQFFLKTTPSLFGLTDGDNLVKGVQDGIVEHGCIQDDRKIVRYVIDKIPCDENGMIVEFEATERPKKVSWSQITNPILGSIYTP